ncbi:hypothetical protein [Streptomyces curacoi]|uniref:Uncharacterized protein n=1 Tax=Streptomyces curacoi TaxID=146536 RepID=A0A124GUV6_9ACTN|nr:hypothetical protein [Streptomyces curacoi]KUM68206.1 hypothetical protein AQI70_33995 [Streptomyces curacoi]
MPSVVGLLEKHELAARRRVETLREEADRIEAELAVAEQEWQEWTIARKRVGVLLSARGDGSADAVAAKEPGDTRTQAEAPPPTAAAKPKSQVPVWRQGLAGAALSVDYQRIVQALADRVRLGQAPLSCQELTALFGVEVVPARVEALRSKAKRLVARGWLAEPAPGRFTLATGVASPGGGS